MTSMNAKKVMHGFITLIAASAVLAGFAAANAFAADKVVQVGNTRGLIIEKSYAKGNWAKAAAMPLPESAQQPSSQLDSLSDAQYGAFSVTQEIPVATSGAVGSGRLNPVTLVPKQAIAPALDTGITPQEYGTGGQPYTTNRTNASGNATTRYYPFSAAGRLLFNIGSSQYLCSASLIKPGVVVTAAHCVAGYGTKAYYSGWQFAPGYDNGVAPFGTSTVKQAWVLASYLNGTDPCYQRGVVCTNDVAVLVLNTKLGTSTGYLGYGTGGYSYVSNQALITQLGYPVALDNAALQQRTDSQGYVSTSMSNNTVIGSLMTGGSSGGPWVVNLGMQPTLNGTTFGLAPNRNVVVGVTSWGYTSTAVKQQGASPFTSANIGALITSACTANPGSC